MRDVLKSRKSQEIGDRDFVDLLLKAQDEQNVKLTEKEVVDNCVLFVFAGSDSMASSLAFTIYLLALHPEVQQKVAEEIRTQLQDIPKSMEDVSKLKYTAMVFNESLRMYSPSGQSSRSNNSTDVILDGHRFPKGTRFIFPTHTIHHDPEYWPEPDAFKPERWINEDAIPKMAFLPFGLGPRNCIGVRFALMEAKLILARIVSQYSFILAPGFDQVPLKLDPKITTAPKGGVWVTVEPRKNSYTVY